MKARLPWILLAVSLAFNVFAAVGRLQCSPPKSPAATTGRAAPSARDRVAALAEKLNLSAEQRKEFEQAMTESDKLREARSPLKDKFLSELIKDSPDEKVLEDYMTGPETDQYRVKRLELMTRFVKVLSPEQRQMFVQLMKKP